MFIEVYIIPTKDWNEPVSESIKNSNRRLININDIVAVKESNKCKQRAEIHLKENGYNNIITVVGTYHEISDRIEKIVPISRL
jgi:hypothetical protein